MEICQKYSQQWKNSDAVLIVEEKKLHVHTCVLSMASPVFEKMFTSGFKESNLKKVEMPEKEYDLVVLMLDAIYPQFSVEKLSFKDMLALFHLSKEYMIGSIPSMLEKESLNWALKIIQYGETSSTPVVDLLEFADQAGFNEIVKICADFIGRWTNIYFSYPPCSLMNYKSRSIQSIIKKKKFKKDTVIVVLLGILRKNMNEIKKNTEIKVHDNIEFDDCHQIVNFMNSL